MAYVAVETTAETSAATSAVQSPLALVHPPVPPPRILLDNQFGTRKLFLVCSRSNLSNFDHLAMASKSKTPNTAHSQPDDSSTPSPPPPPPDVQTVMSPLPPDLPPPPDCYLSSSSPSSSPPPPPPPPSYLFPELSSGDLPPPPPPQVLKNLEPQSRPLYVYSYDPPSPEIKSEYDPELPPGFTIRYGHDPLSPPPPPVPPPPRPAPPPPPTPPVRQASKENLNLPAQSSTDDGNVSTTTFTCASSSAVYLASAEETQTKESTSCNYPANNVTETHISTEESLDGTCSGLSSSTLTATLLLTPESGLSPLPPHALRVSPVPTDANTASSRMTDDLTITSGGSDMTSTPNIFDSRDTTFDIDTPEVTPQLSEIMGTHSPTPNEVKMNSIMDEILADKHSASENTPQLSDGSGPYSATPTEERLNSVNNKSQDDTEVDRCPKLIVSSNLALEVLTLSPPDSSGSEKLDDYSAGNESISENTDYSLTEKIDTDFIPGSLTATSNTEAAQMSSPFSTEPPSLFSLPTDSDTISADMDSLAADMLSPMADFESYPIDVDTSTIDSVATTRAVDMFLSSSSNFSDTAYATADSNMESATMSPVFTESCTITPIPAEFVTPMSTNPTTTPVPSPIPSSPLPYFDAIPPDSLILTRSHTSSINPPLSAVVTSASRMIVSASEHHSEYQSQTSNAHRRLVPSQLSDLLLGQVDKTVSPLALPNVSQQTCADNDKGLIDNIKGKQNLSSSDDKTKSEIKVLHEKESPEINKKENISAGDENDVLQDKILVDSEKHVDIESKSSDNTSPHEKHIDVSVKVENGTTLEVEKTSLNEDKSLKVLSTNIVSSKKETLMQEQLHSRKSSEGELVNTEIKDGSSKVTDKVVKEDIKICQESHLSVTDKMKVDIDICQEGHVSMTDESVKEDSIDCQEHTNTRDALTLKANDDKIKEFGTTFETLPKGQSHLVKDFVKEAENSPTDEVTVKDILTDEVTAKDIPTDFLPEEKEITAAKSETERKGEANGHGDLQSAEEDIFDGEFILICKELTDEKNLKLQSSESELKDDKNEGREHQNASPSPSLKLGLSGDYGHIPSDAVSISSTKTPTIAKIKSYPSSPVSSSPPKHSVPTKFSSLGGSMSPRLPVSPAKSPLSTSKDIDISVSPKSQNIIPFSKSPEEAMEILDAMVGNMETLSADLPHSPVVSDVIDEKITGSKTSIASETGVESPNDEPKAQESADLEISLEKPTDTKSNEGRNEKPENYPSEIVSNKQDSIESVTSKAVSPSSPLPGINQSEVTPHTPPDSLSLSSCEKDQDKVTDSASEKCSPVHVCPSDSVKPLLLSPCTSSDADHISSQSSQPLHADNFKTNENTVEASILISEGLNVDSKVEVKTETDVKSPKALLSKEIKSEVDTGFESLDASKSDSLTNLETKAIACMSADSLDTQKDSVGDVSDLQRSPAVTCSDSLSSFSSPSLHSIVEDVVQPPPGPRAKTPPLPPPRSCLTTPRPGMGAPLPPPRQYVLIPVNSSQVPSRRHSPPPAPPRSTSVRRSPPPPPPRSTIMTPAAVNEWIEFPPLPPPPTSTINTPSTPPKLTPVPEESSFPTTPLPPKESHTELASVPSHQELSVCTVPKNKCDDSMTSGQETRLIRDDSHESPSLTDVAAVEQHSSVTCTSNSPPALPPMPEEDAEEEPPPPPPPPVDFRDESTPPLPLPPPPPPDSLISPPPPPTRCRILTPPLPPPPKTVVSPEGFEDTDSHSSGTVSETNKKSILLASDMASGSNDKPAISPVNDMQGAPSHSAPALSSSAPVVPPPLPPMMPVSCRSLPSSSQIPPPPPPISAPPPPKCPIPQSSKPTPNSALWTVSPYGKVVITRNDLPLPSPEEEVRKTFHNVKNWGLLEYGVDTLAVYTQLRPNIQMGPQCGLVALSMASQVFPETKEVATLLKDAKEEKYTSHGEMFSSENMAKLASSINGMEATVRRDVLCNPKILLELLIQGNLILVPYDADQNHMPNLRNGHKAHWGVICGCLVQCQSLSIHMGGASKVDSRVDNLWHMRPRSRRGNAPSRDGSVTPSTPLIPGSPRLGHRILKTPETPPVSSTSDGMKTPDTPHKEPCPGKLFETDSWSVCSSRVGTPMIPEIPNEDIKMVVLWRQGKSRNLIAAPLEKLVESNDQLFEYPSPGNEIESEFIIGSVQDGLAGQVVVLHKTKTALSDLVGILQEKEEK